MSSNRHTTLDSSIAAAIGRARQGALDEGAVTDNRIQSPLLTAHVAPVPVRGAAGSVQTYTLDQLLPPQSSHGRMVTIDQDMSTAARGWIGGQSAALGGQSAAFGGPGDEIQMVETAPGMWDTGFDQSTGSDIPADGTGGDGSGVDSSVPKPINPSGTRAPVTDPPASTVADVAEPDCKCEIIIPGPIHIEARTSDQKYPASIYDLKTRFQLRVRVSGGDPSPRSVWLSVRPVGVVAAIWTNPGFATCHPTSVVEYKFDIDAAWLKKKLDVIRGLNGRWTEKLTFTARVGDKTCERAVDLTISTCSLDDLERRAERLQMKASEFVHSRPVIHRFEGDFLGSDYERTARGVIASPNAPVIVGKARLSVSLTYWLRTVETKPDCCCSYISSARFNSDITITVDGRASYGAAEHAKSELESHAADFLIRAKNRLDSLLLEFPKCNYSASSEACDAGLVIDFEEVVEKDVWDQLKNLPVEFQNEVYRLALEARQEAWPTPSEIEDMVDKIVKSRLIRMQNPSFSLPLQCPAQITATVTAFILVYRSHANFYQLANAFRAYNRHKSIDRAGVTFIHSRRILGDVVMSFIHAFLGTVKAGGLVALHEVAASYANTAGLWDCILNAFEEEASKSEWAQ